VTARGVSESASNRGEVVLYRSPDGQVKLDVQLERDTVGLSQAQMAELFLSSRATGTARGAPTPAAATDKRGRGQLTPSDDRYFSTSPVKPATAPLLHPCASRFLGVSLAVRHRRRQCCLHGSVE
jgi:hypothetical protein